MKLDLMKIFEGYVKNYQSLNLTSTHGKHSFTMKEIEYFLRLGSMLGYETFTEDTVDGEERPMDLSWWGGYNKKNNEWTKLILHLERENYYDKDEETLKKLFTARKIIPQNLIGIIHVKNMKKAKHLLTKSSKMCKFDNALMIFRIDEEVDGENQVKAYLLKKDCKPRSKTAYSKTLLNSDVIYMYFK